MTTLLVELTENMRMTGTLTQYQTLHRCKRTGIAWVEDGSTGNGHSCHPNIHASGSVRGMKKQGYWAKDAETVKTHGFIYNISHFVVDDNLDRIAASLCRCGGYHGTKDHGTFTFQPVWALTADDARRMREEIDANGNS